MDTYMNHGAWIIESLVSSILKTQPLQAYTWRHFSAQRIPVLTPEMAAEIFPRQNVRRECFSGRVRPASSRPRRRVGQRPRPPSVCPSRSESSSSSRTAFIRTRSRRRRRRRNRISPRAECCSATAAHDEDEWPNSSAVALPDYFHFYH